MRYQIFEVDGFHAYVVSAFKMSMSWRLIFVLGMNLAIGASLPATATGVESLKSSVAVNPTISVRFDETQFPPTTHKFGFNATWSYEDQENKDAINAAANAGAPMAAALVVTKPDPYKSPDPQDNSALKGLFTEKDHVIQGHANSHLTNLRRQSADKGMVNFLQIAGTPNYLGFTFNPTSEKPAHGNWYSLPNELPTLSGAFGSFVDAIYSADHAATVWSFWQEPEHTLDKRLSIEESVSHYLDFFTLVGPELRVRNPDAVVAGIQMNCSSGESSPNPRHHSQAETSKFKAFAQMLLKREAAHQTHYPLDYLTIQNYRGEHSAICVKNSRMAFAASRFNTTPLIFNEWDFDIPRNEQRIDRKAHFDHQYNRPEDVVKLAGLLKDLIDQPDVSYVLLMRDVFRSKPLAYAPLAFINSMSELRRPLSLPANLSASQQTLEGLAAGDDGSMQLILWNHDRTHDQLLDLDLMALGKGLVGPDKTINITTLKPIEDNGRWSWEQKTIVLKSEQSTLAHKDLRIPSLGFVMIQGGAVQSDKGLSQLGKQARYIRQENWIDRGEHNHGEAPHGMGHYEVRTGSLIASADGQSSLGMVGVLLGGFNANATRIDTATLRIDIDASGLASADRTSSRVASAAMAIRMEYLDGDKSLGTYTYQSPSFHWPEQVVAKNALLSLGGEQLVLQNGTQLVLEVGKHAPESWATADGGAHRMMVSLVVVASEGPATVRARLSDGPVGTAR